MTAIAYRDGVMAADSLTSGDGFRRGYGQKIVRSGQGTLGACAGVAGQCAEFRCWVASGRIDEWIRSGFAERLPISNDERGFGGLVVTQEGRVICVDFQGRAIEMAAPFYVEGAAEQLLQGAMAAGASAEDAVRIAIEFDCSCGGDVQVERL